MKYDVFIMIFVQTLYILCNINELFYLEIFFLTIKSLLKLKLSKKFIEIYINIIIHIEYLGKKNVLIQCICYIY